MTEKKKAPELQEARFTKEQILSSQRYKARPDLVRALLKDGESYTLQEVDGMLESFAKRKVK